MYYVDGLASVKCPIEPNCLLVDDDCVSLRRCVLQMGGGRLIAVYCSYFRNMQWLKYL